MAELVLPCFTATAFEPNGAGVDMDGPGVVEGSVARNTTNTQRGIEAADKAGDSDVPAVDPALVEVLIAAQFVVESPAVIALEEIIRTEVAPKPIHRASFPH